MVAEIWEAKDYAGAGYLGEPADFLEKKLKIEVHVEARLNAELNSFYGNNEKKEAIEAGQNMKNTAALLFPETDIRCICESIRQYDYETGKFIPKIRVILSIAGEYHENILADMKELYNEERRVVRDIEKKLYSIISDEKDAYLKSPMIAIRTKRTAV